LKLTITKSINSVCFYVQRSVRRDDGRISSVTVEKLGNLEAVKTKANGRDPYQWARDYVEELNRKEYEEKKEIIISYSPAKLLNKDERMAFNCGYLFLQKIYSELGLDRICVKIAGRWKFQYDLNEILSRLVYTRIIYPASKLGTWKFSGSLLEQSSFGLHDIYRALSVLANESDFIQEELYKNSQKVLERRKDLLYYDCTNYYFEIEQEDDFRKYGKSKQHRPLPIVGMGMFMDYDGIPVAFSTFPGNQNEQPTLKPLEKKILRDFGMDHLVICTDAGLSSLPNRKFNDVRIDKEEVRSFITTQSIKNLPDSLQAYALDPAGWHLAGDERDYDITKLDDVADYDRIFYKEQWIKEDISRSQEKRGVKALEQRLIVSYSIKYRDYLRRIRDSQVRRAERAIESGRASRKGKNQEDPNRFIGHERMTESGEACEKDIPYIDQGVIDQEAKYDGFYAICTDLAEKDIGRILMLNRRRWQIEECFRIMKTEFRANPVYLQRSERISAHFLVCFLALLIYRILEKKLNGRYTCEQIVDTLRGMMMTKAGNMNGYIPSYTRTDLTDALHEFSGFRTDHEITSCRNMRSIIAGTKKPKKK
jgi:transposase